MSRARVASVLAVAVAGTTVVAWSAVSAVRPLPQSFCSPVVQGNTKPQYLVVSDFPLRFFPFAQKTLQFQAAIRYVLKQRHFKAGAYSIGYQACDDSSPQSGSGAIAKCVSNAKAYARARDVIGLIGTWSSTCAAAELPFLNQAPGGPLALISPTNTNVGLTHAGGGTAPDEPGRYYPTGKRSFVRIISADDAQAVADAVLAKQIGAKSVFVLDDGSGYGLNVAAAFRKSAAKIGLKVVGRGSWTEDQTSFDALAGDVAKSSPDAVFLGGFECPNCGVLIKALRGSIGPNAAVIVPDGFSLDDMVQAIGVAAEGLYGSVPGEPLRSLPKEGQKIETLFGPPRLGSGGPSYVAQATAVLLDAIAASDGTRASVVAHLLAAHVRNGIIGSFRFNRNGDTTFNPTMIFRVSGGKSQLDRVITPRASLIG